MIASSIILSLIFFFVFFSVIVPPYNAYARVTGTCSNCYTMHNSQGGDWDVAQPTWEAGEQPRSALVCNTCVGCHTGTNDGDNTIPYVYSLETPNFGVDTLAGGNFYWVAQGAMAFAFIAAKIYLFKLVV